MNKLILLCLFSAVLVAITYAEDTNEERSLLEVAVGSRVVREAARGGRRGKGKGKGGKRGKKARKMRRKKAKKAKKSKGKGGKRGGKRGGKKGGKRNMKRKNGVRKNQARNCMAETCVTKAVDAMDLLGGKMANFNRQKKRIENFIKQMGKKAGKKDLFAPLLSAIREAGGGNASNLLCNGATGAGADKLISLTADITACADNINASCSMELESSKVAEMEACAMDCETFTNLTTAAMEAEGADACTLWESEELANATAAIRAPECQISELNAEIAAAKKTCSKTFGACRKLEDEVSGALSACSPANSPDAIKAAIAQGVTNKAAAAGVSAKIAATLAARSTNTSCSDFAVEVTAVSGEMIAAPLLAGLADMLNAILAMIVTPCSDDEKAELTAAGSMLDDATAAIDDAIDAKNEELEIATGSTVSVDGFTIDESGVTGDTTMA